MAKIIDDPDFSSTTTPLVSDAAVASVVRLGYCAIMALMVGWGMWLAPRHAVDILVIAALVVVAGGAFVATNMVEIDPDEY